MAEINPSYIELDKQMSARELDSSPIPLLEKIKKEGRVWDELSEEYGVDNPDPPWRISLEATCDGLSGGYWTPFNICLPEGERKPVMADATKIDSNERRWEEDKLVDQHYADVPFPERQLLALAHTMIRRGMISEEELAKHMKVVDERLHMADGLDD